MTDQTIFKFKMVPDLFYHLMRMRFGELPPNGKMIDLSVDLDHGEVNIYIEVKRDEEITEQISE